MKFFDQQLLNRVFNNIQTRNVQIVVDLSESSGIFSSPKAKGTFSST